MKEKTEKVFWLFFVPLGVGIILLIVNAVIGGITFKMVYEILMDLDILNVLGVLCLIIAAVFGVLYVKQRWKASIVEKDVALSDLKSEFKGEKKHLKSELEDKTKEYDELYEKTKPPYSVDKLIKAEGNYNPIKRVWIEGDPPHLIFDIRVINRTNYYFTPKKVFLACYHGEDLVFKEDWEERAKTPHIIISELQRFGDGSIQFHVPKEKIENNMRELTLKKGYVEYTTEEEIIHDTERKSVKVYITKLEYKLDEKTASEPMGGVVIAK